MRQAKGFHGWRRQRGFTLFEMVVSISSIVILYMVAEQRLNELPAAAERASFYGVLDQIKTGVNLAMVSQVARGGTRAPAAMVGTNPMLYLLEAPSNYLGEQAQVTDALRRRNAWYFETSTGQLVYLVGGSSISNVYVTVASVPVNLGQIRFRIQNVFIDPVGRRVTVDGPSGPPGSRWEGVLLEPVYPYAWESQFNLPETIEAVREPQNTG